MNRRLARFAVGLLTAGLVACGTSIANHDVTRATANDDRARATAQIRPAKGPLLDRALIERVRDQETVDQARDQARDEGIRTPIARLRGRDFLMPEFLRPGTHTMVLEVGQSLPKSTAKYFPNAQYGCTPATGEAVPQEGFTVGWEQLEILGTPCFAGVSEVALHFDDSKLKQVPEKTIDRAVLTYEEVPAKLCSGRTCWRSGSGNPEHKPYGCVVVRIPTSSWLESAPPGLLPYSSQARPAVTRLGPREWDVTEAFTWQQTPGAAPLGAGSTGFGFLLAGGLRPHELEAEDNTSCASIVSRVQLHVTYTVPGDEAFRAPR